MEWWEFVFTALPGPLGFVVGVYVLGGKKLPKMPQLRFRRNPYDMTKNRKFVQHDAERHRHRIEAEDQWLEEWVLLLGKKAPISDYYEHQLRFPDIYHLDRKKVQREAERARIASVIQETESRKSAVRRRLELQAKAKLDQLRIRRLNQEEEEILSWMPDHPTK